MCIWKIDKNPFGNLHLILYLELTLVVVYNSLFVDYFLKIQWKRNMCTLSNTIFETKKNNNGKIIG